MPCRADCFLPCTFQTPGNDKQTDGDKSHSCMHCLMSASYVPDADPSATDTEVNGIDPLSVLTHHGVEDYNTVHVCFGRRRGGIKAWPSLRLERCS